MELVDAALPRKTIAQDVDSLSSAARLAFRHGLTSVQEAGGGRKQFEIYEALRASGRPMLRTRLGLRMEPGVTIADWERRLEEYEVASLPHRGDPWISAGIVKAFADGVIETGTAAMLAPYEGLTPGQPGAYGFPYWEPGELTAAVRVADRRGWQIQVHSIGDGAVRLAPPVSSAYARASARSPRSPRPRRSFPDALSPAR